MENNDLNKLCKAVWGGGEYLVHIRTSLDGFNWYGTIEYAKGALLMSMDGTDPVDVKNKLDQKMRDEGRMLVERAQKTIESLQGLVEPNKGSEVLSLAGEIDWSALENIYKKDGKILAIKECRTITGMGLKESKEAIEERFESNKVFNDWWQRELIGCTRKAATEILLLLGEGKIINAIKFYREISGAPLKDAKDTIEGITSRMRSANGGWDIP
jgi:ribosomal protein L7/L12